MAKPEHHVPDEVLTKAHATREIVEAGKERAALLPRKLLGTAAIAAATQIALRVVTDQYEFRNAKDAVEAAKTFAEIGRLEMGEASVLHGEARILSPEEIAERQSEKDLLLAELAERAKAAGEKLESKVHLAPVTMIRDTKSHPSNGGNN